MNHSKKPRYANRTLFVSFLITLFWGLTSFTSIQRLYTRFGNAKHELEKLDDGVIRIYFDRQGTIYPPTRLIDDEIEYYDSRLRFLYEQEAQTYIQVCREAGLGSTVSIEDLQAKLIQSYRDQINSLSTGKKLVFLIHGFNKHPVEPRGTSAYDEFKRMREKITKEYSSEHFQFVEVYWDGCTWVNGDPKLKAINTMRIWNNAQPHSNEVALELRRILQGITADTSYVLTHSLGASVITCALFNVVKFPENDKFQRKIYKRYSDSTKYCTPRKYYSVGLIAPAVPGHHTFKDFPKRTVPTNDIYNYKFVIGYNRHDPALTKVFGLSKHFGATSLGCLESEVASVEHQVNKNGQQIVWDQNFSSRGDGTEQNIHDFTEYIANAPAIDLFLTKVFR